MAKQGRWHRRRRSARSAKSARSAPHPAHFAYSRWDGTQTGFEFDVDHLLDELADDLLYHGDPGSALRRLMADGFRDSSGRAMMGLREMLEQLRERRRALLDQHDPDGVSGDIAESLRAVVQTEREALADLTERAEAAREAGDERQADLIAQTATGKNLQLDMMPPDLAGQFKALDSYDFESNEARQQFQELVKQLREQFMQQFLDQMSSAVTGHSDSAAEMQDFKDMLAELNDMLARRSRGETPDFEGFMQRHGHFFPENPSTLDELLEVMARRVAAAQSLFNSMTPDQRNQLQQLSDQLLADMDLNWHMSELSRHLQQEFPNLGWDQRYEFGGVDSLDFGHAVDMLAELGDIDQLQNLLRGVTSPGALAEVDIEAARRLLGDDAAASLQHMAELNRMLEEAGLIENREGRLKLTPRAIRKIGQAALQELFTSLELDKFGRHGLMRSGLGHERTDDTKPYEYGDPFNLHIARTVGNAVARNGGGVPVRLHPEDFEVERTEQQVRSATVLMLDLSLSMPMRNNFLPAKKVATALHALIASKYPQDFLGLVTFSEVAREVKPERLAEVSWDYVYGTNMQHGFMLARRLLNRQTGNKQIIMITDGEPTAHITASGHPYFSYPPSPETITRTLSEVARCTRDGIRINTFMLDASSYLTDFVQRITQLNGGRAFLATTGNLGDYVLMDFVEHKRRLVRSHR